MKWPLEVTFIRHDTSLYNAHKEKKYEDPLYQEFKREFEANPESKRTVELAMQVWQEYGPEFSDANTPLEEASSPRAEIVGRKLASRIKEPNVIFCSPYLRTKHTLDGLRRGWPALYGITTHNDVRLVEQGHGLAGMYWDWRVFQALNPMQRKMYELMGPYWYPYPQGEDVPRVQERIMLWFNTLTRDFRNKRVLVVTHHLTILALRANLERLGEQEFINLDEHHKPINCGVTIYRGYPEYGTDGHLKLEEYNVQLF